VVNVGDDGDIAEFAGHGCSLARKRARILAQGAAR
jgi:hypothetical protein